MKQKHTQARKARRCSAFRSTGVKDTPYGSRFEKRVYMKSLRRLKRQQLQPRTPKTFGLQLARTQRVFLRRDQFGQKVFKTIYHAVEE